MKKEIEVNFFSIVFYALCAYAYGVGHINGWMFALLLLSEVKITKKFTWK